MGDFIKENSFLFSYTEQLEIKAQPDIFARLQHRELCKRLNIFNFNKHKPFEAT